ncbi:MAG TPA: hypothetical protein VIY73_18940, partial [Polyangiaceae bacterium]
LPGEGEGSLTDAMFFFTHPPNVVASAPRGDPAHVAGVEAGHARIDRHGCSGRTVRALLLAIYALPLLGLEVWRWRARRRAAADGAASNEALVLESARPLPRLCTKCGKKKRSLVDRRLPLAIRRKAVVVPLCRRCDRRWSYAWTFRGLWGYAAFLSLLPSGLWFFSTNPFVRGALFVPTFGVWLTLRALEVAMYLTREDWFPFSTEKGGAIVLSRVAPAMVRADGAAPRPDSRPEGLLRAS